MAGLHATLMDETAAFMNVRLEPTRWTSVDVYGRPWMAPRAGYKLTHKLLISSLGSDHAALNTPSVPHQ
jgi:hypothetical protein